MENFFISLCNVGVSATYLIFAVMGLRALLTRMPKRYLCLLWSLVGLRLLFPLSIESDFSVLPSEKIIPDGMAMMREPVIDSGIGAVDQVINPIVSGSFAPDPTASANPLQILFAILPWVWLLGVAAILVSAVVGYLRLRRRVLPSIKRETGVYLSDEIETPFLLGFLSPKIYLPSGIDDTTAAYVLLHERAHLARFDHLIKPLCFLLAVTYWFHPMVWVAFFLFCRDLEGACDERVLKTLSREEIKGYSEALLRCATDKNRGKLRFGPLAFGEVGVKERIRAILNYKKPSFWITLTALILATVLALTFLTVPKRGEEIYSPDTDGVDIAVLRERYPDYFSLDADRGLTVYIWQLSAFSYSCALFESGTSEKDIQLSIYSEKQGTTVSEMKAILSSYEIEKEKITLILGSVLYSSYLGAGKDAGHRLNLSVMFELDAPMKQVKREYDTAIADIDGDGKDEVLTLVLMRTEIPTVALIVKEQTAFGEKTEYFNYLCEEYYDLSFEKDSEGELYVKAISPDHPDVIRRFDFRIYSGNVFLSDGGMPIHDARAWDMAYYVQP